MREVIIRNSARCLRCGDEVVSEHRHDIKSCSCGDVIVDGGKAYLRRVFKEGARWEETSIVEKGESSHE